MSVDLATLKRHLRIDGPDEDALLTTLGRAAQDFIHFRTGMAPDDIAASDTTKTPTTMVGVYPGMAPDDIAASDTAKLVLSMLVGHWYRNREAAGDVVAEIPMGASVLLDTLRIIEV